MVEIRKKIDSDWKKKAAAEKAKLQAQAEAKKAADQRRETGGGHQPTFRELVTTFAMQAQMALGIPDDPRMGRRPPNLDSLQFIIGMLELLKEKTAGNLDEDESSILDGVLEDLKTAFERLTA